MPKESFLTKIHEKRGAVLGEFLGYGMPLSFGDTAGEYRAVREEAGLIDLSFISALEISGSDSKKFLQSMLTNDVERIPPSGLIYSMLLTRTGKMIADMRVRRKGGGYIVYLAEPFAKNVQDFLSKHVITEDVNIAAFQDMEGVIAIEGRTSSKTLEEASSVNLQDIPESVMTGIELFGKKVEVVKADHSGSDGFEIRGSLADLALIWEAFLESGKNGRILPVGMEALNTLRIEAGIPWPLSEINEAYNPLEANLKKAISYTKGCYLGQEVISKATRIGHPAKKLSLLRIEGSYIPACGDPVMKGSEKVGEVTSSAYSPLISGPVSLAYIATSCSEPGSILTVGSDEFTQKASVTTFPLIKAEEKK